MVNINGLPMMPGGAVDIMGNAYGTFSFNDSTMFDVTSLAMDMSNMGIIGTGIDGLGGMNDIGGMGGIGGMDFGTSFDSGTSDFGSGFDSGFDHSSSLDSGGIDHSSSFGSGSGFDNDW